MKKEFSDETMQSSSSNGSSSASANSSSSVTNKTKEMTDSTQPNGELFLLYRYLRNRKIYHGINAKNGANRKKGVMIPQEFSGKLLFAQKHNLLYYFQFNQLNFHISISKKPKKRKLKKNNQKTTC